MLDKHVGDALLRLDLTPPSGAPVAQIERIIDLDHRRVRRWTRIAIVLWVLAALGAVWIFILGGLTFPVIAKLLTKRETHAAIVDNKPADQNSKGPASGKNADPLDDFNSPFAVLAKLVAMCMVFGTASFMILVFAGIATVLLLLRTRTATLRQINANLLLISDQLKLTPPAATLGST
jgi:hypothetical protein